MPAVTVDDLTVLDRLKTPGLGDTVRPVKQLIDAPQGYEGEGFPVHSFGTLLAELATLTRNRVVPAGADAPKWSIAMISPASPTMSRQPCGTPASTETRALTAAGRTFSR